jgi:tRNA-Thr(GGU) m(6)t(6)A37 methyltransferase TsaA
MPKAERDRYSITLRAIGYVENEFDGPVPADAMREAESRIVLDPAFVPGLGGLEAGQQLLVLFIFHLSRGYELFQHPRGDTSRPRRGVFALRSPRRPNPIGLTEVQLVALEGDRLRVRGLDALNGTPVLDIKPG